MRIEADRMWGYFEWLIPRLGLLHGAILVVVLSVLGFLVCYLIAMARYGPSEGFYVVTRVIYELFARDLPGTSGRRIYAIGRLAFQEAMRRRVLAVMAVFIVGLLFAGWFLDPNADFPARLYISFVLTGTSYLVLLLGLFLSCFSLPSDIKNKTVQTIVTKPVRSTEIVVGRIFGFTAVGTMLLVIMGLLSYVFVSRGVRHPHDMEEVAADGLTGKTTFEAFHSHSFEIGSGSGPSGSVPGQFGVTDEKKGHKHLVTVVDRNGQKAYEFGPAVGMLEAKIPVFGSLRFTNREGVVADGLNVGYESNYQKYIEGGTLCSAIWTFDGVTAERFGDDLLIELTLKAFRTYKGDIVTGVQGTIVLRNPNGRVESERIPFIVKEFAVDQRKVNRQLDGTRDGLPNKDGKLDLYRDLAPDGKLEILVRCSDKGQYFGMSQADLYIRQGDSSFGWNMFKGYVSIWLQMLIIICFGVMFSTFLSGPVAMVATLTCLAMGFFGGLAVEVATGKTPGGGPLESMIRMANQSGAMVDLDLGNKVLEQVVKGIDLGLMGVLSALSEALPSFSDLNTSEFVAYGVNIFDGLVARHITMAIGYFVLTSLIGYFFLKTREMAA